MRYSSDWLKSEITSGFYPKFLFFWGHQPSENGLISKSCFSQWWVGHPFVVNDIEYKTAEHWMMAGKARLFDDQENLKKILDCESAATAKKLGRAVHNFDSKIWDANCCEIVKKGNLYKFGQHPELAAFLLKTNNRILVEASPVDTIWGIGLKKDSPDAMYPEKWKGTNYLGFVLMEVRDELETKVYTEPFTSI